MSMTDLAGQQNRLTHEEAVRRARALAPSIRARAMRAEKERRIPRETVEEFVGAGLARLLTPERWGGYEISHDAACDVVMAVSAACASTGWCCSFLNIHTWWLAQFPEEGQHDVWRDTPDVNLAAVIAPQGNKAIAVDGGYRIGGRWSWASGVDHCHWAILTAVANDNETEKPYSRCFVIPRQDYAIEDTWFNVGMKGTGSNDVIVDDVFVPAHRSVALSDIHEGTTPGAKVNTGPIYGIPSASRKYELVAPALGAARGAFAEWLDWSCGRTVSATGQAVAESAHIHIHVAEAETDLDAAALIQQRNLDLIRNGPPIDMLTRAHILSSSAQSMKLVCRAMDVLFHSSGSSGMRDESPIQRAWRDVHTIASHISLNPDSGGMIRGRLLIAEGRARKGNR
jgi:3-hydroxy-9,10-secoandrosta-1,3,5(10)-triene-9,17-dione monooxygenase